MLMKKSALQPLSRKTPRRRKNDGKDDLADVAVSRVSFAAHCAEESGSGSCDLRCGERHVDEGVVG